MSLLEFTLIISQLSPIESVWVEDDQDGGAPGEVFPSPALATRFNEHLVHMTRTLPSLKRASLSIFGQERREDRPPPGGAPGAGGRRGARVAELKPFDLATQRP